MKSPSLLSLIAGFLPLTLAACASGPPAAEPPAASVKTTRAEKPPTIDLLCHEGVRYASYDKLGVPSGEYPIDVAVTSRSAWVLFSDRLVQTGRSGERVEVLVHIAPPGERLSRIDVDPTDGSVWLTAETTLDLFRVSPEGRMRRVKMQRKVEGTGGFLGLMVGPDAIYAQPTCADAAVWRLDRSGKLLGTAFEMPKEEAAAPPTAQQEPTERRCSGVRLERDVDGHILALVMGESRWATWEVDDQGTWTPSDSRLFEPLDELRSFWSLKGVDIGEKTEQWYFTGGLGKIFFWKGRPVFLGSGTIKERSRGSDTVLYLPGEPRFQEVLMACNGFSIWDVATDPSGYVAITERFMVFGEFAGAPDLP